MLSVIDAHHRLDINATDRAAGAHIDDCTDTSSAEPSVAARDMCDAISLQLSAGPGVAGDVEVVAVAAAGDDAAAAGWSSASSSSLGRTGEETGYKSQSLVGAAPAYLADELSPSVGRRSSPTAVQLQ